MHAALRFVAYAIAAAVGCVALFYMTAYFFGTLFALTSGGIVARYPAKLEASYMARGGTYLPFSAIPRCGVQGTVSVEDKRFFYNPGVDPIALVRAGLATFRNDHQDHGGSTITQQLARIVIREPRAQPSLIAELWSELRVVKYGLILEHDFSKEKILELYLNSVYYGHGAVGFYAAAHAYFNTDPRRLTAAQCYYLTGLPQAPSYFGSDPAAAALRYLHVLSTLRRNGYLTSEEAALLASSTPRR